MTSHRDGDGQSSTNIDLPVDRRTFLGATGVGVSASAFAGCLDSVGDDGVFTIGALAPEPSSDLVGLSIAGGAEVAVEELNENGGILGNDVELHVADTGGNASGASDAYQEVVLDEEADLTLGNFASEALLAIVDDIAGEQIMHLITGVGTPEVTRQVAEDYETYKYLFRVGPYNSYDLGNAMVDFADEQFVDPMGWEDVAILYEQAEWTGPVVEVLEDRMPDLGFNVTGVEGYALTTEDFSPIFDDLEDDNVDGVCTVMAHTGAPVAAQWYGQQRPFGFGGIHVPAQYPTMWDNLEGAIEYVWTQTTAVPGIEITEKTQPFTDAFIENNDVAPVYTGFIAYDAVHLFAAYAEEAGTTDQEEIIDMMAANEVSYTGTSTQELLFTGPDEEFAHDLQYDREDHLSGESAPVWVQWQDEEQVSFFPDAHQAGDYQQPEWI